MKATIEVYKFTELQGKAREKAADWLREGCFLGKWWEFVYDDWEEKLGALGWTGVEIEFTGFYSQGDGASFTGTLDLVEYIKKTKIARSNLALLKAIYAGSIESSVALKRTRAYNYVHERSVYLDDAAALGWGITPKASAQFDALMETLKAEVIEQCRAIYHDLEAESEAISSDEAITDMAEANEYLFDAYGDPAHHLIVKFPVAEVAACAA